MSESNGRAYGNKVSKLFEDFSQKVGDVVQAEIKELHKIPDTIAVTNSKLEQLTKEVSEVKQIMREFKDKVLNLVYLIVIGAFLLSGVKGLGEFFK